jgi:hypothetical protein
MAKKQAPLGSTKGKRRARNLSEPAEPTNSQLGGPATEVTNPSDARENLENGSLAGIGRYLRDDVAGLLKQIAKPRHQPPQGVPKQQGDNDPDLEFEYDTVDMVWAIESRHFELVGGYLGELAKLIMRVGDMLDPTPEPIKDWSLTSLKEKLIKIGAKVVSHGRYVAFQMAEVAIPRQMFQEILRLIAELRPQPPPVPA